MEKSLTIEFRMVAIKKDLYMRLKAFIQVFLNRIVPRLYNNVVFMIKNRYICHIKHPRTFNEKIQWRKYYQHDLRFASLVDKWEVRKTIERLCPEVLIPSYGVFNSADEIDFEKLPNSFIIKPTHGFGKVIICDDKERFDKNTAKRIIQDWLSYNQFYITGEWQYRDLKPRIIVDKLIGNNIKDYKFFCFNGEPRVIQIDSDRYIDHKRQLRDKEWNRIHCELAYPNDETELEKPERLDDMLKICRILSSDFDFVRVDLFWVDGNIYFSELTFTPGNGMDRFVPRSFDYELGKLWIINRS